MPLFWSLSSCMILVIVMMLIDLYFYKELECSFLYMEVSSKYLDCDFMW